MVKLMNVFLFLLLGVSCVDGPVVETEPDMELSGKDLGYWVVFCECQSRPFEDGRRRYAPDCKSLVKQDFVCEPQVGFGSGCSTGEHWGARCVEKIN